ncbi:MAG: NUDIX hydrolase [Nocardioidaceae bacterium]
MTGSAQPLHADATDVLTRWHPPDATQSALRRRYLRHLADHDDAVWRTCRPDHLTASALVVSADRRHVLLTLHATLKRWLQMGGHCEVTDRTLAEAARREAVEESGIPTLHLDPEPVLLSLHRVPCGPIRPAHHLDVQYVASAPVGAAAEPSDESDDLRWFDVAVLPAGADDSVRSLVQRSLARLTPGR